MISLKKSAAREFYPRYIVVLIKSSVTVYRIMEDLKTDSIPHAKLTGFYQYLKIMYRFPEEKIRGIITCTGIILRRINNLTMSVADIERIRSHIKGLGLTGDTINLYVRSFGLYVKYLEQVNHGKSDEKLQVS